MDALVARAPAQVSWAPTVRYTENNVAMMIGDGVWGVATARDRNPLLVADTSTGNVGWYGTVAEHGQLSYYAMRLRVQHHRVAEVEVILDRKGDSGPWGDPEHFIHDPAFTTTLPAAERVPRKAMVALVDGYFNTVQKNNGVLHTRFDPECAREENGQITTNGSFGSDAQGCEAQFKNSARSCSSIGRATGATWWWMRSVAWSMAAASFDHGATFEDYKTTDARPPRIRSSRQAAFRCWRRSRSAMASSNRIEAIFNGSAVPYVLAVGAGRRRRPLEYRLASSTKANL